MAMLTDVCKHRQGHLIQTGLRTIWMEKDSFLKKKDHRKHPN